MNNQGSASSADGYETRRLACERCRSQKLKYVRTESSGTCQRCRTAKTPCSFGRPLPPGRPPTVGTAMRENVGNNRVPTVAGFRQSEHTTSSLSFEPQPNLSDKYNSQRQTSPSHPFDAAYSERPWFRTGNLDDDDLFNVLNDDTIMGDIDSSDFGIRSTGPDKSNEDPLPRQGREQPGDDGSVPTQLTNMNNSVTSARPRMSSQTHRPDLMIHTALDKRQSAGFASNSNRPATHIFSPTLGRSGELPASKNPPGLMQKLMQLGGVIYVFKAHILRMSKEADL